MKNSLLWIIVAILFLPFMSETVYTPSLPDMARSFGISSNTAEYTLTIYLLAFALGVLTWGSLSDRWGRRPMLLVGYGLYGVGCLMCALSPSIELLFLGRFIQAFGGSVGSVLGQAIARDAYPPAERGKVFSTIGVCIGFAPALGPVLGGFTDQFWGWQAVFYLLSILGGLVFFLILTKLPETKPTTHPKAQPLPFGCSLMMILKDPRVLAFGALVGGSNGIMFGYYAEAPFIFIKRLGMPPSSYGLMFLVIATAFVGGAALSRYFHHRGRSPLWIIAYGLYVMLAGSVTLLCFSLSPLHDILSQNMTIAFFFSMILLIQWGMAIMIPNCLSQALEHYGHMAGRAASVFGGFYYTIVSLLTFLLGCLHNGTLWMLPLFFTAVTLTMVGVLGVLRKEDAPLKV